MAKQRKSGTLFAYLLVEQGGTSGPWLIRDLKTTIFEECLNSRVRCWHWRMRETVIDAMTLAASSMACCEMPATN